MGLYMKMILDLCSIQIFRLLCPTLSFWSTVFYLKTFLVCSRVYISTPTYITLIKSESDLHT